jgi:hypothetical protein
VVVVVGVEVALAAELPPLEGDFVLGTITVTVTLGVVFVTLVPDLPGVVPDLGFAVEVPRVVVPGVPAPGVVVPRVVAPGAVAPGWYAAYSTVWPAGTG